MLPRNASWGPPRPGNGPSLPGLPRLPRPGRRDDGWDDEDGAEVPLWARFLLAVAGGIAQGAAPVLVTYALHKLDPDVFEGEEGDADDASE